MNLILLNYFIFILLMKSLATPRKKSNKPYKGCNPQAENYCFIYRVYSSITCNILYQKHQQKARCTLYMSAYYT